MVSDALGKATAFLDPIATLYGRRLKTYGIGPKGVFWRNREGQELRFELMIGLLPLDGGPISVNDLGCGYGAFFDLIKDLPCMRNGAYRGYDICEDMVAGAADRHDDGRAAFSHSPVATKRADYSFASGTFNLRHTIDPADWTPYVKESLAHLWSMSGRGMAFNMLDAGQRNRERGLHYAERDEYAGFCAERLSADITVIDDYPLKEFTILVRR